jgi:hypothetical protein
VTANDRLAVALEGILAALLPTIAYYTTYEYRVLAALPPLVPPAPVPAGTSVTIDCVATDPPVLATFPSQLAGLVLWPGPSGLVAIPAVGSIVRVGFVNGDPAKPFVAGLDPAGINTGSALLSFATLLSTASVDPVAKAAGLLLLQELTGT